MNSVLSEHAVKKAALYVGLAALAAGVGMAFEYGRAMSFLHAISLSLLAIAVSIAFIGAELYRNAGRSTAAAVAMIAGIGFSIGEYGTHFGYTVGTRVSETQQTGVTNATYKAMQDNRDREASNLEIWKKQLATLLEQDGWTATVKADALRDELADLKSRIEEEKNGKRGRRAGCGKECERLQDQANKVSERLGKVEQREDLSKRIEATQRILDKKVDVAASTNFHSSKIVNQTAGFAQIATWSSEPSESAMSWTQLILGAIIAAITTYLAPFCLSIAFAGSKGEAAPRRTASIPALGAAGKAPNQQRAAGDTYFLAPGDPRYEALAEVAQRLQRGISNTANHYTKPAMG